MKLYIFAYAYDDSGLDVDIHGIYKSIDKAFEGIKDYFEDTCNYAEDDAIATADELLHEGYYEEIGDEYAVQAVYRLEEVNV